MAKETQPKPQAEQSAPPPEYPVRERDADPPEYGYELYRILDIAFNCSRYPQYNGHRFLYSSLLSLVIATTLYFSTEPSNQAPQPNTPPITPTAEQVPLSPQIITYQVSPELIASLPPEVAHNVDLGFRRTADALSQTERVTETRLLRLIGITNDASWEKEGFKGTKTIPTGTGISLVCSQIEAALMQAGIQPSTKSSVRERHYPWEQPNTYPVLIGTDQASIVNDCYLGDPNQAVTIKISLAQNKLFGLFGENKPTEIIVTRPSSSTHESRAGLYANPTHNARISRPLSGGNRLRA